MGHKEDGRRRGLSVQSCRLVMSRDSGCDDFYSFRFVPVWPVFYYRHIGLFFGCFIFRVYTHYFQTFLAYFQNVYSGGDYY